MKVIDSTFSTDLRRIELNRGEYVTYGQMCQLFAATGSYLNFIEIQREVAALFDALAKVEIQPEA